MAIIFGYILLNLLTTIFFRRSNILCCGLFGGSGKIDLSKIKILGFMNDTRGGDGTGYYYNDEIVRGINDKAKFFNLVKKEGIVDTKSKLFIGHARKSSSGGNTLANTHPFLVDNLLVLAHNGTIYNTKQLAEKYNVDITGLTVDSQILAHIIVATGNFDVLNDYVGYAALTMCFRDEPETLYLYHGMSTEKPYTTGFRRNAEVERPLYYMQTKNALYYSSMEESLEYIAEGDEHVVEVPPNTIFKIRNGKFVAWRHEVDRLTANWDLDEVRYPMSYANKNKINTTSVPRNINTLPPEKKVETSSGGNYGLSIVASHVDGRYDSKEKVLFFYKGRYKYTDASVIHPLVAKGIMFADKRTGYWMFPKSDEVELPFITMEINGEPTKLQAYYFHEGIMLNNKASYKELIARLANPLDLLHENLKNPKENYAYLLSRYSKYPITLTPCDSVCIYGKERDIWYHNGVRCNFTEQRMQFANVVLTIKEGVLTKMHYTNGEINKSEAYKEELLASGKVLTCINDVLKLPILLLRAVDCYLTHTHNSFDSFKKLGQIEQAEILKASKVVFYDELIETKKTIYQRIFECSSLPIVTFLDTAETNGPKGEIHYDVLETKSKMTVPTSPHIDIVDEFEARNPNDFAISDAEIISEDEPPEEVILDDESEEIVSLFIAENPLRAVADELQALEESDFAQEAALFLYLENEKILDGLKSICDNHKKTELSIDIINTEKI